MLRTEGRVTAVDGILAVAVLLGLMLNAALGWWWADPVALAGFWSEVLGRPVNPGADTENAAIDATDPASGPRLAFHKVPESKAVKNRLHLDLLTDQFEAENKRLTGLGATPLWDIEKPTARWTTFADPEGNEFDLVAAQPPEG